MGRGVYGGAVAPGSALRAMLRPRRNWTRGVAAQHASLSRWRSPVRIRSGPPSTRISLRPVRPPGRGVPPAPFCGRQRLWQTRPVKRASAARRRSASSRRPCRARRRGRTRAREAVPRRDPASAPRRRPGRPASPTAAARPPTAPSEPGADARPTATPTPALAAGRRADRAGHALPAPRRPPPTGARSRPCSPARASATRRSSSSRARPTRSSRRSAWTARPTRPGSSLAPDAATLSHGPREEPQAARLPARRRRRPVGPGARMGRGHALRRGSGPRPRRLAADRAACPPPDAAARLRPGDDLDPVRRRRHHARPRRVRDPRRQGQGRRLPVRWRDGRDHRAVQGLLGVRLGPAVHEADRRRGRDARSRRAAPTSPSPTSRTRPRTTPAGTRAGRSSPRSRR